MGVIQKQSVQSTAIIIFGFAIGAFNIIILAPKVLSAEEFGLTRLITDAGITLATLCTFGCIPVINKFSPFYKSYLKPGKNDLPFVTLMVCLIGFFVICVLGYLGKDFVVRKFSERSPLFVEYSYLVYPFAFLMLIFIWLESFSWSFKKGVASNTVRETLPRIILTILLLAFSVNLFNLPQFFILFSVSYIFPVVILFLILRKTRQFRFVDTVSPVTRRLKPKMINFGLFIFGAQFLNLLSRTVDTFILSSKSDRGLEDAAVFTIATYIVTIMEVPQRSITSITVPVLAELWKNKDLKRISNIYSKSVSNLLPIGLGMFGLIWLNIHNVGGYLGEDYTGIESIILFMGIGTLIDLGTGANSQIIATSNYWKVDFTTTVIYTLIALPLNYILIDYFGLMGAAYSFLISRAVFNAMRFGFLWYKFGLQPYSWKNFLAAFIAVVATVITYFIPKMSSIVIDAAIRSLVFLSLFLPAIYFAKVSEEINGMIRNIIRKMGFRI
jgi:O-antigen/teichoic acid export membrane protein